MKLPSFVEAYKCIALTAIAVLLGFILWRMPERPLTMESVRAGKIRDWQRKIPLVYVGAGNVDIDNTVDVEVRDTVDVSGTVSIER